MIDYTLVPEHLRDGMRRYLEEGIETGSFLRAVLEDDGFEAFKRGDANSFKRVAVIRIFLREEAPPDAWGSPAKVQAWIDKHAESRRLESRRAP